MEKPEQILAVADGTPAEPALPCPDYPVYAGDDLGAVPDDAGTTFRVWAPSASGVTLRLFAAGSAGERPDMSDAASDDAPSADASEPFAVRDLAPGADGTWSVRCDGVGHGVYYDYVVRFPDGTANRTADPWARAAGVNGRRSMVVDLRRTDPDGWDVDVRPHIASRDLVIWETHIGDFSNDPHSGVPACHRGTYLAFTHDGTSVDGEGDFPTCVAYLKRFGVTAVQLLPFYDYGSVDESVTPPACGGARGDACGTSRETSDGARETARETPACACGTSRETPDRPFNWGYDPLNYNVPEGSYSTDPFHGEVRIRECKRMIQALHAAGIKVIMDVVYNHMFSTDNWFERMIPGYCLRRRADGSFADGSACTNDVATEHPMMRRYIVDSVTYWAREYHIDGFRFDLMGLIDVDTMNAVRTSLDQLPGGATILMHGEPWSARRTALEPGAGVVLADKRGMPYLSPRIGAFCDSTRDAVRGHVFFQKEPGYLTGAAADFAGDIRHASDAWRGTMHEAASVGQVIQYVSAHDDLTLWDKLCAAMRRFPTEADYAADGVDAGGRCADLMRANRLAAGIVFTAAGVPFLLSGEEFARTKHGDSDSYRSPASLNRLDWRRARRLNALVAHYATLIRLRRGNPAYFGGARTIVPRTDETVVFRVGDDCVAVNPVGETRMQSTVALETPAPYDEVSRIAPDDWRCLYCAADGFASGPAAAYDWTVPSDAEGASGDAAVLPLPSVEDREMPLPPYSITVWRRRRHG
ncbi:alpha-amylase family glycosyl hydrolase [Bifidobacterium saguinibicoloris]|uniref:alpha-amylase family glycosyl hydrolase n=1 Tax=Bifidobacterium saguinibicoloris TaxID=2834433 RepID=UPI001C5921C5|nr:alpha-amylase family glycosyl hydrolase [Bifidobacterium saguinibicoloris]MBW3081315.1 pullulanase [Bifidobacterium saguinibicoloris]